MQYTPDEDLSFHSISLQLGCHRKGFPWIEQNTGQQDHINVDTI